MAFLAPYAGELIVAALGTGAAVYSANAAAKAARETARAAPMPVPDAPTVNNSTEQLDAAANMMRSGMGGRTSTVLAAADTGEQDAKRTSKVLLGT